MGGWGVAIAQLLLLLLLLLLRLLLRLLLLLLLLLRACFPPHDVARVRPLETHSSRDPSPPPQVPAWPAARKWSREYLAQAFQGRSVIVGDQPMGFDAFCAYCGAAHGD